MRGGPAASGCSRAGRPQLCIAPVSAGCSFQRASRAVGFTRRASGSRTARSGRRGPRRSLRPSGKARRPRRPSFHQLMGKSRDCITDTPVGHQASAGPVLGARGQQCTTQSPPTGRSASGGKTPKKHIAGDLRGDERAKGKDRHGLHSHSSRLPGLCREAGVADVQSQETIAETLTIICSTLSFAATDGETEAGREVGQ